MRQSILVRMLFCFPPPPVWTILRLLLSSVQGTERIKAKWKTNVASVECGVLQVKRCSLFRAALLVVLVLAAGAGAGATETPAALTWPLVQVEAGQSQSYLATLNTSVHLVERDGLFLLHEPQTMNRTARLAEHVTLTILAVDGDGTVLVQVEAHPVDPDTLRPYVAPMWRGVYALKPAEGQATLVEGTLNSNPLVAPSWLLWALGATDYNDELIYPGEQRAVDFDDGTTLILPLLRDNLDLGLHSTMSDPVLEFLGWERVEDLETDAAVIRLTADVEAEATVNGLFRSLLTGEQITSIVGVPGEFPLRHSTKLQATMRIEALDVGEAGATGLVEMEIVGEVAFERTEPLVVPGIRELQPGDVYTGLLSDGGWILEDGTPADLFTVDGAQGEIVRIELSSQDFDVFLLLLDDEWKVLAEDNDSAGGTDAAIEVRLPHAGTYLLVANTYEAVADGHYTLAVESLGREVDPAAIQALLAEGWERVEAASAAGDWGELVDQLEELLLHTREQLPLQIAEVLLIVERAFDYGEYVPRASRVYRPGDWVHIYIEPQNFRTSREAGRYEIHLTVDATLIDSNGDVVTHLPGVVVWNRITHRPVQDVALSVPLWLGELVSGNYVWRLTVRDMLSRESATAEVPIVVTGQSSMVRGF